MLRIFLRQLRILVIAYKALYNLGLKEINFLVEFRALTFGCP